MLRSLILLQLTDSKGVLHPKGERGHEALVVTGVLVPAHVEVDLAGRAVHTPSESGTPSGMIQGQNKTQIKMLLIARGYTKQKAFSVGGRPGDWPSPLPSRSVVSLGLSRTSPTVVRLSGMEFRDIPCRSRPEDEMSFIQSM